MTGGQYRRKAPFREDLLFTTILIFMALLIFATADYPNAIHDMEGMDDQGPASPGGPGSGTQTIQEPLIDQSGYTAEGASTEISLEVPWEDTIRISVSLTWTDDIGSNDELSMALLLEDQEVDSISGTSGSLSLNVDPATSGNYTVVITALKCPGQVGPLPIDRDNGQDWAIVAKAIREVEP